MIAFSIGVLIFVVGSLYYAFTGKYWEISREKFDRYSSFAFVELIVEIVLFIVHLGYKL